MRVCSLLLNQGQLRLLKNPVVSARSAILASAKCFSTNAPTVEVVFLRHGQSTWNQQNIFIGMTDTPLTKDGEQEAVNAGKTLASDNIHIDIVYTSLLRRSTKTVWLCMEEMGLEWVPVVKDYRLNERHYGNLVGRHKKQCVEEFGTDQVKRWRRSWDEPPPQMDKDHPNWPYNEPRYKMLGIKEEEMPLSESLKCVTKRSSSFWDSVIVPELRRKDRNRLMIVGHENNLRSLIKRLDNIAPEDIINIELPRAVPLVYTLDKETLKPIASEDHAKGLSGRYLIDKKKLQRIAERDLKQVYDLSVTENLEPLRHF